MKYYPKYIFYKGVFLVDKQEDFHDFTKYILKKYITRPDRLIYFLFHPQNGEKNTQVPTNGHVRFLVPYVLYLFSYNIPLSYRV